jgi:hypothetical protein
MPLIHQGGIRGIGVDHSHIDYYIYSNANDLVSTMGFFPEGENVHFYRVLIEESENFLDAHAKVYLASNKVTIVQTSSTYENRRIERIALTAAHFLFSSVIFFLLLPVQLIYRLIEFLYHLISSEKDLNLIDERV